MNLNLIGMADATVSAIRDIAHVAWKLGLQAEEFRMCSKRRSKESSAFEKLQSYYVQGRVDDEFPISLWGGWRCGCVSLNKYLTITANVICVTWVTETIEKSVCLLYLRSNHQSY